MIFERKYFPKGVLYAQIDQLFTYCDYGVSRACMRFIGVDQESFDTSAFNSEHGCKTFLIDVDIQAGQISGPRTIIAPSGTDWQKYFDIRRQFPSEGSRQWYEITFSENALIDDGSYGYALFQNAAPTFLTIHSIKEVNGDAIFPKRPRLNRGVEIALCHHSAERLLGFHVGQGMCSAVLAGDRAYLLDAGAGTPVKRPIYTSGQHLNGTSFRNELRDELKGRSVELILSHPDSDHWRLLDWDHDLLNSIENIYVPDNVPNIVFSDATIKPYLTPTVQLQVQDQSGSVFIEAIRSRPSSAFNDSNGNCLVSVVKIDTRRALVPGDYSYSGMHADTQASISALCTAQYDAISVPHHGDLLSAQNNPQPAVYRTSIAFFSAGDHRGYHHPRAESLTSHHHAGFDVLSKKWIDDVIKTVLL